MEFGWPYVQIGWKMADGQLLFLALHYQILAPQGWTQIHAMFAQTQTQTHTYTDRHTDTHRQIHMTRTQTDIQTDTQTHTY